MSMLARAGATARAATPTVSAALLGLHQTAGNQAVVSLIAGWRAAAVQRDEAGPADINVGFNPMDKLHKLLIAIDQKQVQIHFGSGELPTRHVDAPAVIAELANLTAEQATAVKRAYADHEHRTLEYDLFGGGESGYESDLRVDQRQQIGALLLGTKASSDATKGAAADAETDARAAELHVLLHGDLEDAQIERVMALLRRSANENAAVSTRYAQLMTNDTLQGDLVRLPATEVIRAMDLLVGQHAAADATKVTTLKAQIQHIDHEIAELGDDVYALAKMKVLRKDRAKVVEDLERRAQEAVAAGTAKTVLGDTDATAKLVGGADADVITATVSGDPAARAAARLRKAVADDELSAETITSALRGLREEAKAQARKAARPGTPQAEIDAQERELADKYFADLRNDFNLLRAPGEKHFSDLIDDTGKEGDIDLNRALMLGHGYLGDVDELVHALNGDRKDMVSVERVLRDKDRAAIDALKLAYLHRTGKSLDRELFGEAPTEAGGPNEEMLKFAGKDVGKATGTDRLNVEDFLQRPNHEGGLEEVLYLVARAEREYEYTIDNRGATGAWRDAWGNEQRELLDETITEVRRILMLYVQTATGNPQWTHSEDAHNKVLQLRAARATIRGDRAAYEKATAALRATFEAVAAFALQVALSAVLGPVAELALIGEIGEGASVALRVAKFAQSAAVGTASTIGANLAVYGEDYSLAMLKADLLGGVGGALGPAAIDKMVGPYAKALVAKLGTKAPLEIVAVAKTWAGMEATAALQGESLTAAFNPEELAKAHLMGKTAEQVHKTLTPGGPHGGGEAPRERIGETVAGERPTETSGQQPAETTAPSGGAVKEAGPVLEHGAAPPLAVAGAGGAGEPTRRPLPAFDPANAGMPDPSLKALQQLANERDVIIKARPMNPSSIPLVEAGNLAKPEIIKSKTIKEIDAYIGGPAGKEGLVGFFEPTKPHPDLPAALYEQAMERYTERQKDWDDHINEYLELEEAGVLRYNKGVLELVDIGTARGTAGFKPAAGDLDIFDITHSDGTPLSDTERAAITTELRFMGVQVEHGAHEWWEQQSPETYDPEAYANIHEQHRTDTPLVAVAPGREPQHVWADTPVSVPARPIAPGTGRVPLRGATEVPATGSGPYLDIEGRITGAKIEDRRLSSGGIAGSGGGQRHGVRPAEIPGIDEPAVVKSYPDDERYRKKMATELAVGGIAEEAGIGVKVYGPVDPGARGGIAFATGEAPGGFFDYRNAVVPEGTPAHEVDAVRAGNRVEMAKHAMSINEQSYQDARTFAGALTKNGWSIIGDTQGYVGPDGRWRPIDLTGYERNTDLTPDELAAHNDEHMASYIDDMKSARAGAEEVIRRGGVE